MRAKCVGYLYFWVVFFICPGVQAQTSPEFFCTSQSKEDLMHLMHSGEIDFFRELDSTRFIVRFPSSRPDIKTFTIAADNEWKKSPGLNIQSGSFRVSVQVLQPAEFLSNISSEEFTILAIDTISNVMLLEIKDEGGLDLLIENKRVLYVSPAPIPVLETPNSFQDLSVNKFNIVHHQFPGLSGKGFNVSIKERAIDPNDIDLRERFFVTPLADEIVSLHANQMATIIAGAGNSTPSSKGIAWEANVTSSSFLNPLPDPDLGSYDISVQNHSYGTGIQNFYGPEAIAYDAAGLNADSIVHVFSAGNAGMNVSDHGPYEGISGFANITGTMKMAKNVIVVGGHDILFAIDERNSSGPAYDGRLIPSISAFGPEGTSDAAAFVSGLAIQIQQAIFEKEGRLPQIDLVKAVMIASSNDIGREGIDYNTGYGAVNAFDATEIISNDQYTRASVGSGDMFTMDIQIPTGVNLLKIALNWIDPAADGGAPKALVNDLDLSIVEAATGKRWLPWVLSSFPHADSLAKASRRSLDNLNNTEFITISNPSAGVYQLRVNGTDMITQTQDFAIAYSLEMKDTFQWTYPTASGPLDVSDSVIFRWDTRYNGTGELEISIDNSEYATLSSSVNLADQYFVWKTNVPFGTLKIRMKIGAEYFETDEVVFNVPPKINVEFLCDDRFMISWTGFEKADSYKLYTLDDKFLEVSEELTDTSFISSLKENSYYAVAPVMGGREGFRSAAYNTFTQGVSCYYQSFTASADQAGVALLSLALSTTYNVTEIIWEKKAGNQYVELDRTAIADALTYSYSDSDLNPGVTFYRARIILANGDEVITDEAIVYSVDETSYFVFPNPIALGSEELTVLTDGSAIDFFLIDARGQIIKEEHLVNYLIRLNLDEFQSGMYFYQFRRSGKTVNTGKILLR
ncbi:MAG TPA: S8 family peptidase [Chryseosolibacter sp.]|nr:S8 family peptidase [Chryseosolibacter sp.]